MDRGPGAGSWSDYLVVRDSGQSNLAHCRKPIRNRFSSMAVYSVSRPPRRDLVTPSHTSVLFLSRIPIPYSATSLSSVLNPTSRTCRSREILVMAINASNRGRSLFKGLEASDQRIDALVNLVCRDIQRRPDTKNVAVETSLPNQ